METDAHQFTSFANLLAKMTQLDEGGQERFSNDKKFSLSRKHTLFSLQGSLGLHPTNGLPESRRELRRLKITLKFLIGDIFIIKALEKLIRQWVVS